MKKSRYSESQIVKILKEVESGRLVKEVCREYGISEASYYNWKSKYCGMEASDVKRLKELEEENRRLKQRYAELSLDHKLLKDVIEKKAVKPAVRREWVDYLKQAHGVSIRRACRIAGISDSVYRYRPNTFRDEPVITVLQSATHRYPAYGFSKLFKALRRLGHGWNHKRVHRLYCALNLNKRRRGKKRLPTRTPAPLSVPATVNRCWSMDCMSDSLFCGRRFRTFNVVDGFNREVLAIEIDLNLPAPGVIRVLERIIAWRGYPTKRRMDNGPEFISLALADWAEQRSIELAFIKRGTPTQNSYVERFNRTYRDEILNMYVFRNLTEVRELTESWMTEYNDERPHDSLEDLTPWEYLAKHQQVENSNQRCH
ncbi:IS3 family transposase [Halomonas sp. GD1P12]|uniref:IS3 family transposase n=1 Tax=Halomonas sp. GD1P12 TaxID=2982691 RepID=UPI0021E38995|nr:IS3 family transposase [Halomonas sp. GD1P12]UYF99505.1 IS3 family transposase [Halomonas sp. GD1P12]